MSIQAIGLKNAYEHPCSACGKPGGFHGGHHTLDEIAALDYSVLEDVLGKETLQLRPRCAMLSLETLKSAIRRYQREKLMREHGIEPLSERR